MSKKLQTLMGLFILVALFSTNLFAECDGGHVATIECTEIAYACVNDGYSDYVIFSNHGNDSDEYIYLTTDTNNVILVINYYPFANFEEAGIGICRVWGLAYSGDFLGTVGDNAATAVLASDCYDLSENFITIDRSEVESTQISTVDDENIIEITDNEEATFTFKNTGIGTANYVYVITKKSNNLIVDFSFDGTYNFAFLDESKYLVWGYSYSGDIIREIDDKLRNEFSNGCYKKSSKVILVRKETEALPPITCFAEAGTLTTDNSPVNLVGGAATVSATPVLDAVVPGGYEVIYILTEGTDRVVKLLGPNPSFTVFDSGIYTIHTLIAEISDVNNEDFFDGSFVILNQTTGAEIVSNIETQMICAAFDLAGAEMEVLAEVICTATAGVLIANPPIILPFGIIVEAVEFFPPTVPAGYEVMYILTNSETGVIQQISDTPSFIVPIAGPYRIQSLVAETSDPTSPNYFNLGAMIPGTSTIDDFNTALEEAAVCAAFDPIGADILVPTSASNRSEMPTDISFNEFNITLSVFPNPVVSTLNARLKMDEIISIADANLVITNIKGQVIHQEQVLLEKGQNEFQVGVSTLARGMYQIQLYTNDQQWIERFYKH